MKNILGCCWITLANQSINCIYAKLKGRSLKLKCSNGRLKFTVTIFAIWVGLLWSKYHEDVFLDAVRSIVLNRASYNVCLPLSVVTTFVQRLLVCVLLQCWQPWKFTGNNKTGLSLFIKEAHERSIPERSISGGLRSVKQAISRKNTLIR